MGFGDLVRIPATFGQAPGVIASTEAETWRDVRCGWKPAPVDHRGVGLDVLRCCAPRVDAQRDGRIREVFKWLDELSSSCFHWCDAPSSSRGNGGGAREQM